MLHNIYQLSCCIILLLGLYIAIGPSGQHLCLTGKISILMNDFIHSLATQKIIINLIHCIQKQIRFPCTIIKGHKRTTVYQHSVTLCRHEHRHGNPHIVLIQILVMSSVIVDSFLCLSQSVNPLILLPVKKQSGSICCPVLLRPQILDKISLTVHSFHTIDHRFLTTGCITHYINFCQVGMALIQPYTSIRVLPAYCPRISADFHHYLCSTQYHPFSGLFCLEIHSRIFLFLNDQRIFLPADLPL